MFGKTVNRRTKCICDHYDVNMPPLQSLLFKNSYLVSRGVTRHITTYGAKPVVPQS